MRLLLCLVLLGGMTLSGCIQADEGPEDPLVGWCPQWDQGPGSQRVEGTLDAGNRTATFHVAPPGDDNGTGFTWRNLTLDLYRLEVAHVEVEGGAVQLRAVDVERDRSAVLRDHRFPPGSQVQASARFQESTEDVLLEAALNAVDLHEGLHTGPLRLEWRLDEAAQHAAFAVDVTFHYRVCGARV